MVKKLCVRNCQGNYAKDKQIKVFRLPEDLKERKPWLSVIPRDNIPDHKDTVVCKEHWTSQQIIQKLFIMGKNDQEIPRQFFFCVCVKKSLILTKASPDSTTRKTNPSSKN